MKRQIRELRLRHGDELASLVAPARGQLLFNPNRWASVSAAADGNDDFLKTLVDSPDGGFLLWRNLATPTR